MKLLITSDLHVDFKRSPASQLNWDLELQYDAIVVAGDIANKTSTVETWLREFTKGSGTPVYSVLGNHDYWDHDHTRKPTDVHDIPVKNTINSTQAIMSTIPGFLNRKIVEIGGERILGCTLWYSIPGGKRDWCDHKLISDWWNIETEARADIEFLTQNLREGDIVITHMLPSHDLIDGQYIGDSDNMYYVSDVHNLIIQRKPKLWISGHSHSRMVKMIGDTLYIRNPRGYPSENPNYSHLIVDTSIVGQYGAIYDVGWYDTHGRK